jgi:hypothetical protein
MIALRLIEDAQAAGCSLEIENGDLVVEADRDPPAELLASLRRHKAELIAALLPRDRAPLLGHEKNESLRSWTDGFAALSRMPAPSGFSSQRWGRIINATGIFLDRWGTEAVQCRWSDLDVFGCDPDRPDARFDCMGLALLLDRAEVIALDCEGATLKAQAGSELRYRRRLLPAGTVLLWDLRALCSTTPPPLGAFSPRGHEE